MSTAASTHADPASEQPSPVGLRLGPRGLVFLFFAAVALVGAALLVPSLVPAVLAAFVAALLPKHHAPLTRVVLASMAARSHGCRFAVAMTPAAKAGARSSR